MNRVSIVSDTTVTQAGQCERETVQRDECERPCTARDCKSWNRAFCDPQPGCPRQAVREPHEWTKPGANDVSLRGGPWKLDAAPSYVVSSSPSSVMLLTLLSTSCSSLPYSQLLNRSQPSGFSSHSPSCQCRLCCDCFDTYLRSLCKCSGCICAGWGAPSLF